MEYLDAERSREVYTLAKETMGVDIPKPSCRYCGKETGYILESTKSNVTLGFILDLIPWDYFKIGDDQVFIKENPCFNCRGYFDGRDGKEHAILKGISNNEKTAYSDGFNRGNIFYKKDISKKQSEVESRLPLKKINLIRAANLII